MYCPNCNKEFEGKFCPECGTKLIEKPASTSGVSVNLGDANAISGGLHISNNVVERAKSDSELLLERKARYRTLCRQYLSDGKIDETERIMLDNLAGELDLDKETQNAILSSEIENSRKKSDGLDKASKVVFIQVTKKLKSYDLQGIVTLLPKLKNMERNFIDAPVKFYYFLISSVLCPSEIIRRYESHSEDSYWLTYWCTMSYLLRGDKNKAEQVKNQLSNWAEYDEENSLLLDIAISIKTGDFETAEAYRDVLEGAYSEELADFGMSLFSLLNNVGNMAAISPEPQHAFYLNGMFYTELEKESLGVLLPDGTLGVGNIANEAASIQKPFVPTVNNIAPKEDIQKKEKKVAMKDVTPVSLSKKECERRADLWPEDGGIKLDKQEDGLFILRAEDNDGDSLYGLWDREKELLILDIKYKGIWHEGHDIYGYEVKSEYGRGFVCTESMKCTIDNDNDGTLLIGPDEDMMQVWKKGKNGNDALGIIDTKEGKYVLDPDYVKIESSSYKTIDGLLLINNFNGQWGIFDCNRKENVVECKYKDIKIEYDAKRFFFLVTNLADVDKKPDIYVPGAHALYKGVDGGVATHELYEHILILYKSGDGPYAICNAERQDNAIEFFDDAAYGWYDESTDEDKITPLFIVEKNEKCGVYDAENCNMLLGLDYDDVDLDEKDGDPCLVLKRDGQSYTFNMFTRQFE